MVTTISEGRVRDCDNMTWDMGQGEGFKAITVLEKCESFLGVVELKIIGTF